MAKTIYLILLKSLICLKKRLIFTKEYILIGNAMRHSLNHIVIYHPLKNFAISQYFAFKNGSGKTAKSVHQYVKGNKPVDLFMFNTLNEYTLGQLLCIYEYKTLFEASFSDINPFDQYGVELGKQIFKNL